MIHLRLVSWNDTSIGISGSNMALSLESGIHRRKMLDIPSRVKSEVESRKTKCWK